MAANSSSCCWALATHKRGQRPTRISLGSTSLKGDEALAVEVASLDRAVSARTVNRTWTAARAWLRLQLDATA